MSPLNLAVTQKLPGSAFCCCCFALNKHLAVDYISFLLLLREMVILISKMDRHVSQSQHYFLQGFVKV